MACEDRFETLSALADGELEPGERTEVERHLVGCASCRAALEAIRGIKHGVGDAGLRDVPSALAARIEADAKVFARPGRIRRLAPVGIGASALAAAAALLIARPAPHSANLAEAIVDDHVRYYPAHDPAEIASADPDVVSRWLSERLPFEVDVPELPEARLVGGRRCTVGGDSVALLFYERDGRRLSLFVFDDPGGEAATRVHASYEKARHGQGACAERMRGYGLCVRSAKSRSYVLVSELDSHAMGELLAGAFGSH